MRQMSNICFVHTNFPHVGHISMSASRRATNWKKRVSKKRELFALIQAKVHWCYQKYHGTLGDLKETLWFTKTLVGTHCTIVTSSQL